MNKLMKKILTNKACRKLTAVSAFMLALGGNAKPWS